MPEVKYVCQGNCHGQVTEHEHQAGAETCQTEGCSHFNQPLLKKMVCEKCGAKYDENEPHTCGL